MKQDYSYSGINILNVENVSLTLPGVDQNGKPTNNVILRDINITIDDVNRSGQTTGQIIGFLGPSGRGKTQLFKIIAGLRKPTTGTVMVMGKPTMPGNVGVVAQNYPLMSHHTVLGNLMLSAKTKPGTKSEYMDRIKFYLEKFGLADKMNSYPAQLSGGQRQRIAIIQQLLCSENFLLLDEPFSGLDVNMIHKVSETILEVANLHELNTVIVVSHDYISTSAISNQLWMLGYDYDEETNKPIPGARIKYVENLMDRGLSWNYPEVFNMPEFNDFTRKVRSIFNHL